MDEDLRARDQGLAGLPFLAAVIDFQIRPQFFPGDVNERQAQDERQRREQDPLGHTSSIANPVPSVPSVRSVVYPPICLSSSRTAVSS